MDELLDSQVCPYCEHEVEDHQPVWDYEAVEEVKCDSCDKTYVVKPQYTFK